MNKYESNGYKFTSARKAAQYAKNGGHSVMSYHGMNQMIISKRLVELHNQKTIAENLAAGVALECPTGISWSNIGSDKIGHDVNGDACYYLPLANEVA